MSCIFVFVPFFLLLFFFCFRFFVLFFLFHLFFSFPLPSFLSFPMRPINQPIDRPVDRSIIMDCQHDTLRQAPDISSLQDRIHASPFPLLNPEAKHQAIQIPQPGIPARVPAHHPPHAPRHIGGSRSSHRPNGLVGEARIRRH